MVVEDAHLTPGGSRRVRERKERGGSIPLPEVADEIRRSENRDVGDFWLHFAVVGFKLGDRATVRNDLGTTYDSKAVSTYVRPIASAKILERAKAFFALLSALSRLNVHIDTRAQLHTPSYGLCMPS